MPTPRLIHPVRAQIERHARSEQIMDPDTRAPFHGPRTTSANTVPIQAQVSWSTTDDASTPEVGGARPRSAGYILVRTLDMDVALGAGQRFKRGDRITVLGNLSGLDLYIIRSEPMGHYPSANGVTLIKYHFEDRKPVRQQGDL